ncbi:MAG: glycine oxidase ThiO [Thiotrichaceae bacterium]|nr:glycine oxidase ThiO [Thiotrichaceae bacterium]
MSSQMDVAIVGGGVVGLLTAYYLQAEQKKVCIIDQSAVGTESSWAGGGILTPLYPWLYDDAINDLSAYGQEHYEALSQELFTESTIDPQWLQSGLIMLGLNKSQSQASQAWQQQYQVQLHDYQSSELHQYEPQLNKSYQQGYIQHNVAQLRNPWLVQSLRQYLQQKGVEFRENTPVTGINQQNGKATGVRTVQGNIKANKVVIASGAWSSLFPELSTIDVKPVMGQMILYKTEPHWLKRIVMERGKYVIPREDGHILCGSTIEWNGYKKITTKETRQSLKSAAETIIPALKDYNIIKQWSGLRPGSPNGVPYIGKQGQIENLYVNTGHYRYGVVMGLGSARLLTDIINNKQSFIDPSRYALSAIREKTNEYR